MQDLSVRGLNDHSLTASTCMQALACIASTKLTGRGLSEVTEILSLQSKFLQPSEYLMGQN
jgi:hypothetical protein